MPPPYRNTEEVFSHFKETFGVDGDGDIHAVGLFAYSLFEKERFEWMSYSRTFLQHEPTAQEIENWITAKPVEFFSAKATEADEWYCAFARVYLQQEIEEGRAQAVEASLSGEIHGIRESMGKAEKFFHGFWREIFYGTASDLTFALLLIVVVFVIVHDVSITDWIKTFFLSSPTPTAH